ncbi:MAG: 5-(carboxyamino)imidazole ribonucleotide mutase [Bdellovibrio sp. 28-41-41]|nr:MAG: 5-(carboxyamino)imidazole ribonucleotide mutase [Bdellovibrio sp. 28-41-41]
MKKTKPTSSGPKRIAIVMGSESDLKVMNDAVGALKEFGISFHLEVVSAHRTPKKMYEFALSAVENGYQAIIAGAGGAAHLPGMIASLTTLPVIGVPISQKNLQGMDSLLSIVQMPKGVPVATVAIDNAYNAGILAVSILANSDSSVRSKLEKFKTLQIERVAEMNKKIKPTK